MADRADEELRLSKDARAAADPVQTSLAMAGRPSLDAPRAVRFSEDVERAAPFLSTEQPKTRSLKLDSGAANQMPVAENLRSSSATSVPRIVTSAHPLPSVTSPRTRDRGYSMRRTLFTKGIIKTAQGSPIGWTASQEYEEVTNKAQNGIGGESKLQTTPTVAVSAITNSDSNLQTKTQRLFSQTKAKEKAKLVTETLPNYDIWARKRGRDNFFVKNVQNFYDEKIIKGLLGRRPLPPSKDGRHIDLDVSQTTSRIDERTGRAYISNVIRSSRYTIWDFIPRQLLFQFSKLANAYFLLISILQMIPGLSPTGRILSHIFSHFI
jgi:phospholipid-translocating ATPase